VKVRESSLGSGEADYLTTGFQDVTRKADGTIMGYVTVTAKLGRAGGNGGHLRLTELTHRKAIEPFTATVGQITRMEKNSYDLQVAGKVSRFPTGRDSDYDENYVRLRVLVNDTAASKEVSIPAGATKTVDELAVDEILGGFNAEEVVRVVIDAEDRAGYPIGHVTALVKAQDFGSEQSLVVSREYAPPSAGHLSSGAGHIDATGFPSEMEKAPGTITVDRFRVKLVLRRKPIVKSGH
jgi:hypothetical protein